MKFRILKDIDGYYYGEVFSENKQRYEYLSYTKSGFKFICKMKIKNIYKKSTHEDKIVEEFEI